MDTGLKHLYAAAHAGNIDSLRELLQEDELLLEWAVSTTEASDNPLHIAAIRGYAGFAKEIIHRNRNLAREVNRQGLTPLHLAAVHGHFQVAEELIQVDGDLCRLQDNKDGYLPIHIAVIKRRLAITTMLIEKCLRPLNELITNRSETLLHLAVKANSLETVQHLTSLGVTQSLLNTKDENGNTCLHLAVAGRQQKVIKDLLSQPDIEVNPVNSAGLTPLDVLLVTNHEMGDLYLGEMLRAGGGKTAKELSASEINIVEHSSSIDAHNTSQATLLSTPSKKMTRTRSKIQKPSENMEKNLIVVATLVATVTFAAALNPPGGSIQMPFDDRDRTNPNWIRNWENMDTLYPAGSPVYLWHLRKFFMYDYFALFASVSVIILCLPGFIRRGNTMKKILLLILWISIFFMVLAFTSALSILLYNDKNFKTFRWFTPFFKIRSYFFFVVATAQLFLEVIISLIGQIPGKPSWMSNLCSPEFKQFIRWAKIKGILLRLFVLAISIFVGFGVSLAIKEMANSSIS